MNERQQSSSVRERRLRVLLISDFYPPIIGGMERYVQTLAHELARRGHHVAVATLRHGDAPPFEVDQGVRVYRLAGWSHILAPLYADAGRQFHPTAPDPGVMAGLQRVIEQEHPDVVHAQGWMLYSFLPLKERSRARLVVTLHDYGLVCPKKTYLCAGHACTGPAYVKCVRCASDQYGSAKSVALTSGLYLSSRLLRHVDRFVAVSEAGRQVSYRGAGQLPRRIDVVPAFIPDTPQSQAPPVERPAFVPPDGEYILFVGMLSPHKGLHVLVEAYTALSPKPPLVLIGTPHGEMPKRFPPGVIVVQNAPHAEVMAAWAHCTLGVVPSIWPEPCPLVAIEAMACGRPLIAAAVGGLPDLVVDGETGLLVPPGDSGALRTALQYLLDHPDRRWSMGKAAHRRALRFRASTVISQLEHIYTQVLEEEGKAYEHNS